MGSTKIPLQFFDNIKILAAHREFSVDFVNLKFIPCGRHFPNAAAEPFWEKKSSGEKIFKNLFFLAASLDSTTDSLVLKFITTILEYFKKNPKPV